MNTLSLSLITAVQPVILETSAGQEEFELREMSAAKRDGYLTQLSGRFKRNEEGKMIEVTNMIGLQATLLSMCFYRKSDGSAVPKEEIQKWPTTAVTTLFDAAQKINKLAGEEEKGDQPKND